MMNCLKCDTDLGELGTLENHERDFVVCPVCGNKMSVEFEEVYTEETGDEYDYFFLKDYKD